MSTSAGLTLATSRGRTDHSNAVTEDRAATRAPTAATAAMSPITPATTRRAITILLADRRGGGPRGRAPRVTPGPRPPGGQLAVDALLVQRLQQALSRLAERRGLEDEDRHGVGDASLTEQRLAHRRIGGRGELGEALPEIRSVIAKGLFRGDAIRNAAAA